MAFSLVLGSGGVAGVSWTIGILASLAEADALRPSAASLLVGTSAGSVVGAVLAADHDLADLVDRERTEQLTEFRDYFESVDAALAEEIFRTWSSCERTTPEVAKRIAALAAQATRADPEGWVARTGARIPEASWGCGRLRIVAVTAETGERVVWDESSGVDLARAMAASSAVPGLVPPMPIGGHHYLDGGVWSSTNADVALDSPAETVLVTCPQARLGLLRDTSMRALERERRILEDEGRRVIVVTPGSEYDALGPNHMDAKLRAPAVEIGLRDGREWAKRLLGDGIRLTN